MNISNILNIQPVQVHSHVSTIKCIWLNIHIMSAENNIELQSMIYNMLCTVQTAQVCHIQTRFHMSWFIQIVDASGQSMSTCSSEHSWRPGWRFPSVHHTMISLPTGLSAGDARAFLLGTSSVSSASSLPPSTVTGRTRFLGVEICRRGNGTRRLLRWVRLWGGLAGTDARG